MTAQIKLTQWLCPQRHCLFALLWDETETEIAKVLEQGEAMFTSDTLNRWCGICGQAVRPPETGITKFRTMEEAMGPMREEQRKNAEARDILGGRF